MSRSISLLLVLLVACPGFAQGRFAGVGREATPAEIQAWDIDVRPDFKGLPTGAGSVKLGEDIWEAKCASCHGTFGESNSVFAPIVGGTTTEDIKTGRVAALLKPDQGRTTLMKLSRVSALWDYINRAMPWNAPKTLTVEEVYAVTAYVLSLGDIVPADFVLSDANIAEVQQRLPNRNGMTTNHGLLAVNGRPDVKNTACMKDCPVQLRVVSQLPDHARGTHGDLAGQNRTIGPVRGINLAQNALESSPPALSAKTLAEKSGCLACHGVASKVVGPGLQEIATRYRRDAGAAGGLVEKVKSGGQGVWGQVPMPGQQQVKDEDIRILVQWILGGAK